MPDLKTILESLAYQIEPDEEGMPPYDSHEECVKARDEAIAETLAKIEGMIPEKKKGLEEVLIDPENPSEGTTYTCKECGGHDECDCSGYNQAIEDFKANLGGET